MSDETKAMQAKVTEILAREKIEYKAAFVPQSISRNAGNQDKTLNWKVTFERQYPGGHANRHIVVDYAQGIGHVPGYRYNARQTVYEAKLFGEPWETGKYNASKMDHFRKEKSLPEPHAADIVHCIVMDSTDNHDSFEDWARDYGYDTDSRKAEETYNACRKQH